MSQPSNDEWRSQMNEEIRREILFYDDAEVEIRSAGDDSKKQIEDLEYFENENFDLIIIAPNEAESVTPTVRRLYEKGIPVIVFDRALTDSSYTSYIDLDNVGIGEEAARYAARTAHLTGGEVIELKGLSGSTPAEERHYGFKKILDRHPDITFSGTYAADWNAMPAERITDSLLASNPRIKIIYAQNDVMAIAAAKMAEKHGRGDITVIGTDGAPSLGIRAVEDSVIDVTLTYPTVGDRVIQTAMDILHGKKVDKVHHIPSTYLITAENAGMHLRMNEIAREKTEKLEQINSMYTLAKSRQASQRIIIYAVSICVILLFAVIIGLIYFMRQKEKFRKSLADKNECLLLEQEKKEELYARLEESTKSKLAFYTNVSHDLRTPLTLIADPLEMISHRAYLPDNDRMLMKMAVKNVKILRRMIDQILDFRKYEAGKMKLSLQSLDIVSLLHDWVEYFRDYAVSHSVALSLTFESTAFSPVPEKLTMDVDNEKLERVVFNLLSNALKFTPSGGEVKVICRIEPRDIMIEVSDTGIGMEKEETEKIFNRFYQVDRPRPNGSGIGLSLTRAFVELMGGTITVESVKGKGSCFTVRLPMHSGASQSHVVSLSGDEAENEEKSIFTDLGIIESVTDDNNFPSSLSSDSPGSGMKGENGMNDALPIVLVIDDNEEICRLVSMILNKKYQVLEAYSGKEGIKMAMKFIPDAILCDIMMPDMDGLEVTRILKNEKITSHIPVSILTACRMDQQRVRSYESGADGFLSKPFSSEMLKARVESLILNRRRIYDLLLDNLHDLPDSLRRNRIPDHESRHELENEFYREFIGIVKSEYSDEDLSVPMIAEKLGIGATQFTRKIKALTGKTPVEIIRSYRLSVARKMILSTDQNISEIAFSCGFSSSQYFSRCFREEYGQAPSDLRNNLN